MESSRVGDGPRGDVGMMIYSASIEKPPSPSLRRKQVFLTITSESDEEVLKEKGLAALRQARILRLCREAYEQGTLLLYKDLITILLTSLSTLKRDLRLLRKEGFSVPIYRKRQKFFKGP